MRRRLTIIESPFAAMRDGVYLKRCLADSWAHGELPFASHAFFPLFLDEDKPADRQAGINAGFQFWQWAERIAFYVDHGESPGMRSARDRAVLMGLPIVTRRLDDKKGPGEMPGPL